MSAETSASSASASGGFVPLPGRRDVLRVGSLTLAAALWPGSNGRAANAATAKAKSVIYLWMGGGVTHIDSFDPKPEAPEEIRGTLTAIDTRLPGVQFCETMPHLAHIADRLAVVRSFSHDSNDHLLSQVYTLSGRKVTQAQLFTEPNIGAVVSHVSGPRNGLPGYIAVPGITRPGPPPHNLFVGGWLGNQYGPFAVGGQPEQPDFTQGPMLPDPASQVDEDLNPRELRFPHGLSIGRLRRRQSLRESLERGVLDAERSGVLAGLEGQYDGALHLLTSPAVRAAFDVSQESDGTRDEYGRTKIGGRCLLARRLVEAGARFVMVDYGYDPDYGNLWDQHNAPSQNFPHVSKMCLRGYHLPGIDQAFAALIGDLERRGLLESTLVVFLTEFGRTPKINSNGGRDHWGACGSLFFTGGGVRAGQVIGASDAQAAYPVTRSYTPADVAASIYHAIGIEADGRLYDRQNRPHPVLDHGRVIDGLFA
ncbi:MAG: DUF1501 domain-containing protein [Planctomycetes bacterium]|nr:DUF1501 domain-containing protein [Planctomycetota bacterium]